MKTHGSHGQRQHIMTQAGAENALRKSEVRYRRLFETAQDGILILDRKTGAITDANPYKEAGFADYLVKPVDLQTLDAAMAKIFNRASEKQPSQEAA